MDSYRVLKYAITHLVLSLVICLYSIQGRPNDPSIDRNVVKTIKTQYGDEYDCVGLYNQPALQHPLLKNHKIQMRPSFGKANIGKGNGNGPSDTSVDVGLKDGCPLGTVPIRRKSRAELLRAKAMFRQYSRSFLTSNGQPNGFVFAGLATPKKDGTVYHGAAGLININNPTVDVGQYSTTVISIEGGPISQFSVIRVGWMVNPEYYHDNYTRLYTIWGQGNQGQMHGCFNTDCAGFVHTDAKVALDMIFQQISVVRGAQFYVKLAVNQDKSTGNWWLTYGDNDEAVGYWPSNLFSNLANGGEVLRWGGMVHTSTNELPQMGNGDNGYIHSSHFRQIQVKYESGTDLNGTIDVPLGVIQTQCYMCGDNSYKYPYWGYSFYFGGEGGDVFKCS